MSDKREYDWRVDAYESWLLALGSIHERLVLAGAIKPRNDADDQAWFERMSA